MIAWIFLLDNARMTRYMPHPRHYRRALVLAAAVSLFSAVPAQAGLLLTLTERLGLQPVIVGVSDTTGLALDDMVLGLDTALSSSTADLGASPVAPADLGMSLSQQADLVAMDEPATLSATDAAALSAAVDGPLANAGDQPALHTPQPLKPVLEIAYAQTGGQRCVDSDADGVCDRDDQCRRTPPGQRVLANGCHLDAAAPLRLDGVQFAHNRWTLDRAARDALQQLVAILQEAGPGTVEIAGHTDARGSARYNFALSEKRAAAVRRYLIESGTPAQRLRARGYGESQPLRPGSDADSHAANRRVELRLQPR